MYIRSALWILLFVSFQDVSPQDSDNYDYESYYDGPQPLICSVTERIRGGNVTYSQGGLEGSVLTYHCGPGQYPSPVSFRLCDANGEWSPMRSSTGRLVSVASCKDMLCPAQLQLDHGEFWPRNQWFHVGTTQSFSCQEGFTLYGSAERNCTLTGEWTGDTPVCVSHDDDCDDPGIPPGALRSANRFHTGEKVTYRCQAGLALLGSAERFCLENKEWSGSAPRCQAPNTFDSPSSVAAAMAGSLAGVMDVLSPDSKRKGDDEAFGRTFHVDEGSRMNIYILLDTSGSIKKQDFDLSRDATIKLIRKLDSYEVKMKFHVLSFASKVIDIVNITDSEISDKAEDVIWFLEKFNYNSHGRQTGTNLYSALYRVSEMINFFKQNSAKYFFNETQNIIIIETDGFSNTGVNPQRALAQIRNLLDYSPTAQDHTDERRLDVYVFGVGEQVNKEELNALASKKRGEKHFFTLESYQTLGNMFNSIISDQSVTMCGLAQEDEGKESQSIPVYTKPWHVTLTSFSGSKVENLCSGSILSQNWVLTAAHCFARKSTATPKTLEVKHGEGRVKVSEVIMHPKFNVYALTHRNVSEFYDYDIALVQTNASIPLSWKARPICLPCTKPASRALKKINSTCEQHRKELLTHEETLALFIHKQEDRKETHIHTQTKRPGCVEKAMLTLKMPTNVTLDEYVPDRFLCTGGTERYKDAITCQGDSGGSLFLQKRKRYFQVGVVSWGTIDICDQSKPLSKRFSSSNPPPDARDFHIDLFKLMPWLKQHLGNEIQFLPEIN
ncbi:complement C2 [Mugil cephalus]|uniref:complement C2 n=1 Tax=Mugil cephalus TaxID=48193 RepID=UPI001FB7E37D|nr:complement C2 [Mugil cephalus]